jgi:hypothetical protein
MKFRYYISSALLGTLLMFSGCEKQIQEEVFSQLDPATLFTSANGIERVLFGAYADAQINGNFGGNIWFQEEWTCDQCWETGGAVNLQAVVMLNFTWDASYPTQYTELWNRCYSSIRNCNLVLENIDGSPVDATSKARLIAEARFVRASAYYILYTFFGSVPMRLVTTSDPALARASEEEMLAYFEKEFTDVSKALPNRGEISGYQYGRATKGAAMGYLCKFYLNSKQWQKSADVAKKLMDLGIYELWPDYTTLFTVDNEEKNKEFIWVYTCSALGPGNEFMNGSFPPAYASAVDGSMPFLSNMRNWARMDRMYDSFYNSFDPADTRRKLLLTQYINSSGKVVSLLNQDNTRPFKFIPDPNAIANAHGNDLPVIRYADILLARAEALNEISGPTQASLDLIQMVRTRAGLKTPLLLSNFTKETLRDHILKERGWELYIEKVRRQDLLRHGKFISSAAARGVKNAQDYRKLFPIPQTEINANPLCKQNPGY